MTAPSNLLAVRSLLLAHLPLSGTAVGIVGDTSHVESGDSYHLGRPEQRLTGYASTESPRDKAGLCEFASALDIGSWSAHGHDLRGMSRWLVDQCKAGATDTRDIREIIYSLDGRTVHRWDRLGRRTSGDSSHLFHTHVSYFRDATRAGRDLRPLFVRYLTEIGLIEGDDMQADERAALMDIASRLRYVDGRVYAMAHGLSQVPANVGQFHPETVTPLAGAASQAQILAALNQLAGRDLVDEDAIARQVLAELTPQAIAAAIPAELAAEVVDELATRLGKPPTTTPQS